MSIEAVSTRDRETWKKRSRHWKSLRDSCAMNLLQDPPTKLPEVSKIYLPEPDISGKGLSLGLCQLPQKSSPVLQTWVEILSAIIASAYILRHQVGVSRSFRTVKWIFWLIYLVEYHLVGFQVSSPVYQSCLF